MIWEAGEFSIRVKSGEEEPEDVRVAGWIKWPFALDFRVYLDEDDDFVKGWVLTHIPSGYIIANIGGPLEDAMMWGDRFMALPGWEALTPETSREMVPLVRPLFEDMGKANLSGLGSPLGPVWQKARAVAA